MARRSKEGTLKLAPMREEVGSWKASFDEVEVEVEVKERDSARLRERRSMMGLEAVRRGFVRLFLLLVVRFSSSSEAEEEGSGMRAMEPGSSMRKETDSRISAREAGFLGAAAVRRAVAGGRMFVALSGMES